MQPWHNWFHCTGSMYGQWLPGDDRGWRERNHRRDVEADYKHPFPKGLFKDLKDHSRDLMKRDPVRLEYPQRVELCKAFYDALIERTVEVVEISIGAVHWHGLLRFVPIQHAITAARDPKQVIGAAKGKSAYVLGQAGVVDKGGIWAHGCRPLPIEDESHFWNTKQYIHDHVLQGAAVISELRQIAHVTP